MKSGKLTSHLYSIYLNKHLKTYTGQQNFLLIIDSSAGQTQTELYDETFQDTYQKATCTIKVIAPNS